MKKLTKYEVRLDINFMNKMCECNKHLSSLIHTEPKFKNIVEVQLIKKVKYA